MTTEKDHAKDQAAAQLASIMEMVEAVRAAREADDTNAYDDALTTIHEDALSVQVRSGWVDPGDPMTPEEFTILLCTGGPAVRIVGELNEYFEPTDMVRLEYQDWGTPWTGHFVTMEEQDALVEYCNAFYFGA